MNPYQLASRAADELRYMSGVNSYDVAVVLGSGWREGAEALGERYRHLRLAERGRSEQSDDRRSHRAPCACGAQHVRLTARASHRPRRRAEARLPCNGSR